MSDDITQHLDNAHASFQLYGILQVAEVQKLEPEAWVLGQVVPGDGVTFV
jgi:hypothetical protein